MVAGYIPESFGMSLNSYNGLLNLYGHLTDRLVMSGGTVSRGAELYESRQLEIYKDPWTSGAAIA